MWLGNYNKNSNPVDLKDNEKIKEFIVAKVRLLLIRVLWIVIFLCQYEKKRYYVDPAQANLSGIKQQLTGGSTGSADSHGSHKLQSSSLIGEREKKVGKLFLKLLDPLELCRTFYRAL